MNSNQNDSRNDRQWYIRIWGLSIERSQVYSVPEVGYCLDWYRLKVVRNVEQWRLSEASQSIFIRPSATTHRIILPREYTAMLDATGNQLLLWNILSLALGTWMSAKKLPITLVIAYYVGSTLGIVWSTTRNLWCWTPVQFLFQQVINDEWSWGTIVPPDWLCIGWTCSIGFCLGIAISLASHLIMLTEITQLHVGCN